MPLSIIPEAALLRQRSCTSEIETQRKTILENSLLIELLNSFPDLVAVLNRHRQIVYANQAFTDLLGPVNSLDLFGKRPGEALDCQQAFKNENGCGTGESCTTCGAAQAIATCGRHHQENRQECSITQETTGLALEFQVKATPLPQHSGELTLLFLSDITQEKRRRALERIFFHDVMNTAGGLAGMSRLLCNQEIPAEKKDKFLAMIQTNSERLSEEITAQRELCAAENNELNLSAAPCSTLCAIKEMALFYGCNDNENSYQIEIDSAAEDTTVITDRHLLNRVLGNMIKNAREAINPEETIRIGCRTLGDTTEFWVHNPGHIQHQDQLRIFRRSFSTKGPDRGLGTYSIKLLGERYLGGKVSFTSSPEKGTTFALRLPVRLPE
ncbi:MAG: PAS domain-containing sensor histidine kinase [Desulfobulbaceae bacterium]|nr:PAS domain-containing sensor histidine kinase [Desulfobulbaceae bacterium]HIJ78175.1 PAS domain-containing protein [Deltaproteobacteria bacterium]